MADLDPYLDPAMDGNVLAGPLADVFIADVTAGVMTCAGCHREQALAALRVYGAGPAMTARCQGCGDVMLRITRIRSEILLDLRGTGLLRIAAPEL